MHFAHEVLEPESLNPATSKEILPKELEMAKALIDSMTAEWEPTKYEDQYQAALMEMIEEKAKLRPPSAKPVPQRTMSNVVDLVSVLQESLRKQSTEKKPRVSRGKGTAALVKQRRRAA